MGLIAYVCVSFQCVCIALFDYLFAFRNKFCHNNDKNPDDDDFHDDDDDDSDATHLN